MGVSQKGGFLRRLLEVAGNTGRFREHYLGAYSVEMQRQQLDKVDWL